MGEDLAGVRAIVETSEHSAMWTCCAPPQGRGRRSRDRMSASESNLSATRELEVFAESSWLVASTLDLGGVLERLADGAQSRLSVDIVRIWLRDARRGRRPV